MKDISEGFRSATTIDRERPKNHAEKLRFDLSRISEEINSEVEASYGVSLEQGKLARARLENITVFYLDLQQSVFPPVIRGKLTQFEKFLNYLETISKPALARAA